MGFSPRLLLIQTAAAANAASIGSEGWVATGASAHPGTRPPGSSLIRMIQHQAALLLTIVVTMSLGACGGSTSVDASYKPAFLPVELSVGPDGVSVHGDSAIATPIGEFSIGASYSLPDRDPDTIYVIIRDRKRAGIGLDTIFRVKTGGDDFVVVVNGTTTIEVRNGQVVIDVTDGSIKSIKFKRSISTGPQEQQSGLSKWWHHGVKKWDDGWKSSPYKPFMLSRWAYDDSTISKWYGIGFAWFLARLVLALILGIFDIVLSLIFLVAQLAYWFFGPTGRNIVWGIVVLLFLIWMARVVAAVRRELRYSPPGSTDDGFGE
jgi:hypothetical protein